MGSRVQGSGSRVQGSGSRVQGPGSRAQGSGLEAQGLGIAVHDGGQPANAEVDEHVGVAMLRRYAPNEVPGRICLYLLLIIII